MSITTVDPLTIHIAESIEAALEDTYGKHDLIQYSQKIYRQSLKTKNQKAAHRLARETAEKLNGGQEPSSIRYGPTAMPPLPTWSNAPSPSIPSGPIPPRSASKPR